MATRSAVRVRPGEQDRTGSRHGVGCMFFHTGRLAIFAAAAAAIEASPWLCGGDRYCRQRPGPIRRSRRGRKPGLEIQQRGGQDPVHAKGGGQLLRQVQGLNSAVGSHHYDPGRGVLGRRCEERIRRGIFAVAADGHHRFIPGGSALAWHRNLIFAPFCQDPS